MTSKRNADYSPLRVGLIITLYFLVIPYIVDVGYVGDATPSHASQELSTDSSKKFEDLIATYADLTGSIALEKQGVLPPSLSVSEADSHGKAFAPYGYLSVASLISRPPPAI